MAADLSTPAAARQLGVHPDTLTRWAEDGKIPFWVTPGRQRRFRQADIDALRQTDTVAKADRAAS